MPGNRVEIRPQQHCAIVWLHGPNGLENMKRSMDVVASHPNWSVDFDVIVVIGADSDLNDITLEKLLEHQSLVTQWSALHRYGPNSQSAIVCADELKRVIVELWLAVNRLAGAVEDLIFVSLDDAIAGLARAGDS